MKDDLTVHSPQSRVMTITVREPNSGKDGELSKDEWQTHRSRVTTRPTLDSQEYLYGEAGIHKRSPKVVLYPTQSKSTAL